MLVEYFAEDDGTEPVAQWLDGLSDRKEKAAIESKIRALQENGLHLLLGTNMLEDLKGPPRDLYELKGGQLRIVFWHDVSRGQCILLHGFRKTRQRERGEIETAVRRLEKHLARGQ